MADFEATIVIRGRDDATSDQLETALRYLKAIAVRIPPDRRFDWSTVAISVEQKAPA